jgi:excisionase family DNA binding protein
VRISEAAALLPPEPTLQDLLRALAELTRADRTLTPAEAADELRVGRSTIYKLMSEGLPWHPVGARGRRIYATELHDWLRSRRDRDQERRAAARSARGAGAGPRKRRRPAGAGAVRLGGADTGGGTDRESLRALVRQSRTKAMGRA